MRATGIVRKVDELGRVVLPVELRREKYIAIGDQLQISVNSNEIILEKHVPRCIFCKGTDGVKEVMGKCICERCIVDLRSFG